MTASSVITAAAGRLRLPRIGLGTWPMTGDACRDAVLGALDLGYRHIDTAERYENEDAVGAALAGVRHSPSRYARDDEGLVGPSGARSHEGRHGPQP